MLSRRIRNFHNTQLLDDDYSRDYLNFLAEKYLDYPREE